jgi:OOP family OmpA-OmpF porin
MIKTRLRKLTWLQAAAAGFALLLSNITAAQSPPWQVFAQAEDRPRLSVSQSSSLLVFMRAQETTPVGSRALPTDILIDGLLHTALLPGGFSEARVCPGIIELQVVGQATNGLPQRPSVPIRTSPGGITYIEVAAPISSQPLRVLSQSVSSAPSAMQGLRRQVHALSRLPVNQDCRISVERENLVAAAPPAAAATAPVPPALVSPALVSTTPLVPLPTPLAPPPVLAAKTQAAAELPPPPAPELKRRHTLSSEMLFQFGGSRVQDLTPQGHAEIVRIARAIKEQIRSIQSISVQGHTDPMGSAKTNKRLSSERAETVRKILINSGIPSRKIQAEGLSTSQLLVTDCQRRGDSKKDRLACNAPNRRVEIITNSSRG